MLLYHYENKDKKIKTEKYNETSNCLVKECFKSISCVQLFDLHLHL